jgi:hypothetical protein
MAVAGCAKTKGAVPLEPVLPQVMQAHLPLDPNECYGFMFEFDQAWPVQFHHNIFLANM